MDGLGTRGGRPGGYWPCGCKSGACGYDWGRGWYGGWYPGCGLRRPLDGPPGECGRPGRLGGGRDVCITFGGRVCWTGEGVLCGCACGVGDTGDLMLDAEDDLPLFLGARSGSSIRER